MLEWLKQRTQICARADDATELQIDGYSARGFVKRQRRRPYLSQLRMAYVVQQRLGGPQDRALRAFGVSLDVATIDNPLDALLRCD